MGIISNNIIYKFELNMHKLLLLMNYKNVWFNCFNSLAILMYYVSYQYHNFIEMFLKFTDAKFHKILKYLKVGFIIIFNIDLKVY